jgi:hypothetical protein
MIRNSISASLVALVMLRVRADPLDHDDAGAIGHSHFQPVRIGLVALGNRDVAEDDCEVYPSLRRN